VVTGPALFVVVPLMYVWVELCSISARAGTDAASTSVSIATNITNFFNYYLLV
jgi:hypothetical protein